MLDKCKNCLKDCLQIRGLCEDKDCAQYYLQDFVPSIALKYFTEVAQDGKSGKELAEDLICGAATEVLSDLQRININGVSINKAVSRQCYDCTFSTVYGNCGGLLISQIIPSDLSVLSIDSLKIKTNTTGSEVLQVFNADGDLVYQTTINLQSDVVQTVSIPGQWQTTALHIKFQNPSVQLANTNCKKSGCNCGKNKRNNFLNFYGYDGTTKTSQVGGFIPCVTQTCSSEDLICSLVQPNKQTIARLMAYKVAIKLFGMIMLSTNWRETQLNIDKDIVEQNINTLEGKYHELMFGSAQAYGRGSTSGMAQVLSQSARTIKDSCIICNSRYYKATAVR